MGVGLRPKSEEKLRLEAMRVAAEAGIGDIAAGRCRTFDATDALRDHLSAISAEVLGHPSSNGLPADLHRVRHHGETGPKRSR